MADTLSKLIKPAGASKPKTRKGRGVGSGLGKTAGRGQKGQYARNGIKRGFDTDLVQWMNATKMLSLSHPSLFRTGDQVLKVATITVNFNTNDIHMGKIEGSVEAPGP